MKVPNHLPWSRRGHLLSSQVEPFTLPRPLNNPLNGALWKWAPCGILQGVHFNHSTVYCPDVPSPYRDFLSFMTLLSLRLNPGGGLQKTFWTGRRFCTGTANPAGVSAASL